ncbi:MAG: hypothetical protein J5449_10315 [Oscillospiraceae bacterium]|nr:hypothetical protein [Oscillospiraceae bacterium]
MKHAERVSALLAACSLCMIPASADVLGTPTLVVIVAIPLLMLALAILALSLLIRAVKRLRNKKHADADRIEAQNETMEESEEKSHEKDAH